MSDRAFYDTLTKDQKDTYQLILDRLEAHIFDTDGLVVAMRSILDMQLSLDVFGPAVVFAATLRDLAYGRTIAARRLSGRAEDGRYTRPVVPGWAHLVEAVYQRDGAVCRYCGDKNGPFHVDHIQPLRRGGSNLLSNLAIACSECNLSKGAKLITEWKPRRRMRRHP